MLISSHSLSAYRTHFKILYLFTTAEWEIVWVIVKLDCKLEFQLSAENLCPLSDIM